MKLDGQGRITIPQRLREAVGIDKDVVVLGVRDRMEIWDRETYESYSAGFADAYRSGALDPGGKDVATIGRDRHKLGTEVRQSLTLIGMTALTLLASIGLGILAGHIG